jgi:hypothetical protein
MDIEVVANAKGARDTAVVRGLADQTVGTLQAIGRPGSGWIENRYRLIAMSATWSHPKLLAELDTARVQVVEFVDPDYFAVGAWTEAARIAASRGDTAFFRAPESLRALKHAGKLGLSEKSKSVIDGLIQQEGEVSDWAALREDLRSLHQELVTTREPLP